MFNFITAFAAAYKAAKASGKKVVAESETLATAGYEDLNAAGKDTIAFVKKDYTAEEPKIAAIVEKYAPVVEYGTSVAATIVKNEVTRLQASIEERAASIVAHNKVLQDLELAYQDGKAEVNAEIVKVSQEIDNAKSLISRLTTALTPVLPNTPPTLPATTIVPSTLATVAPTS